MELGNGLIEPKNIHLNHNTDKPTDDRRIDYLLVVHTEIIGSLFQFIEYKSLTI